MGSGGARGIPLYSSEYPRFSPTNYYMSFITCPTLRSRAQTITAAQHVLDHRCCSTTYSSSSSSPESPTLVLLLLLFLLIASPSPRPTPPPPSPPYLRRSLHSGAPRPAPDASICPAREQQRRPRGPARPPHLDLFNSRRRTPARPQVLFTLHPTRRSKVRPVNLSPVS